MVLFFLSHRSIVITSYVCSVGWSRGHRVMGAQLFRHPAVLVFQALCFSNPDACGHLAGPGRQITLCMCELMLDTARFVVLEASGRRVVKWVLINLGFYSVYNPFTALLIYSSTEL